jgi:hypothetical protein
VDATGAFACDGGAKRLGRHAPVGRGHEGQFRAASIELGRVAFVLVDMGDVAAKDGLEGLGIGRQREGIGGSPGRDEVDRRLGCLEHLADTRDGLCGQLVAAIAHGVAVIGGGERREHREVHRAGIVGGKKHQSSSSIT